ncbi:hypothetical protein MMC11_001935 [Xylographa trunciseda]|nr:hypothetical protein [Xylographa trunciseda]
MDQPGLMSTVPRELRELYYDVVVCPDLEASGTLRHESHSSSSRNLDRTNRVYKAALRIPKEIGPVMTYEEQRIATGEGPSEFFTPMISLGGTKKDLDRTRETYQILDAHISIRVLHLLPAKSSLEDIECELRVVRLVDEPVYEALSYTWGDDSHRRYILVNDQRFSVTSNLWAALRYLRHTSETRCLWVDAICINQQNITEKNFMVSQMHVIYHNSKRVIAWLGDPTMKSEHAFRFLAKYMSEGPPLGDDQKGWQAVVENSPPMRNVDLSTWDALLDIFGRPWWSRAWIVQEVTCSRAGWTLMCGSSELSGNHLSCILPRFFDALEESGVPPEAKTILDSAPFAVLRMAVSDQDQLGGVLVGNRRRKANEDKDKVYAFTNMVAPAITELRPNYEESTAEVYYQTAVQLIVKGDDLKVLSICENQDKDELESLTSIDGIPRKFVPGLPTWVPNWAQDRTSEELWGGYITDKVAYPFEATGWKAPVVKFHGSSLVASKGLLTIQAKKIATVTQLAPDPYGESVSDAIKDAFRLVANAPIIVPAGQNGADGVLRSFTLDRDAEGERTYEDIASEPAETTRSMHRAIIGRRFFRTKEGFVGLGPRKLKANDLVMLVPGCHVPIALRASVFVKDRKKVKCDSHLELEVCLGLGCAKNRLEFAKRWEVIGETYLHGVMNGELNSILESGLQEYVLAGTEEKVGARSVAITN